ncbi:MAG: hypothetical protein H0X62_06950, partial [Bacteroidetes bacterium]|nr:hypothetical protein [Bacteroidota bacterium]
MKKSLMLLLSIFLLCGNILNAQYLDINWSKKQIYKNSLDGFFNSYIGYNSQYVYADYHNLSVRKKNIKKLNIMAFDKNTMKVVGKLELIDPKTTKEKYKSMKYYKTLTFENIVYVFWTKQNKNKTELYAESFTNLLKRSNPLTKVYEVDDIKGNDKAPALFIMGNKDIGEKIIIGCELPAQKKQNLDVNYKVLNADFKFEAAGQFTLPFIVSGKSSGLTSSYELGDDGNLHIKSYVKMSKEEAKGLGKGENSVLPYYSIVVLETAEIKTFPFKFENLNIKNFNYLVEDKSIKVFGFFCDLKKDPKGYDTHGIFYSLIDVKTLEISDVNLTNFTKAQLDNLFKGDKKDRNKGAILSKKKSDSQAESLTFD